MKYGLRKTIQFSPEMWEEIRKRAFKLKISPSEFIRLCIEEHMVKRACLSTFNEEEWKSRD